MLASGLAARSSRLQPILRSTQAVLTTTQFQRNATTVQKSTASNGVTLISYDNPSHLATLSVSVQAGSTNENHFNNGAGHFLKRLAYQSTQNLSALRVCRLMENSTANFNVSNGRETITYTATLPKSNLEIIGELLADMMRPRLQEWEVNEQRPFVVQESANSCSLPDVLNRYAYIAAFRGQGLGRPTYCPSYNTGRIDQEVLKRFVDTFYVGNRITVVGVGINHEELSNAASAFSSLPAGAAFTPTTSTYFGGEVLHPDGGGTEMLLAYPAPAGDLATNWVIAALLGRFPLVAHRTNVGHGVTSRLYKNIVEKDPSIKEVSAFVTTNDSASLLGVKGKAYPGASSKTMLESFKREIEALANSVSAEELKRAVNTTRTQFAAGIDNTKIAEFYGARGISVPFEEVLNSLEKVSATQVQKTVQNMLKQKPTLVVAGDLTDLPVV